MHIKRKLALILAFSLVSLFSWAAIPPQVEIDLDAIKPIAMPTPITREQVAKIIPTNLQPGIKDDAVMAHIMDHSVNNFVQGDFFKNTEIGKAAKGMENAFKTQLVLGPTTDANGNPVTPQKIDFQLAAFEQKAYLKYTGYANVNLTYYTVEGLNLSMTQALSSKMNLVLSHVSKDDSSRVSINWPW